MAESFGSRQIMPAALAVLAAVVFEAGIVAAQTTSPADPQTSSPSAEPPPAPAKENPGLINEIGKLLQKTPSLLPSLTPSSPSPAPLPPASPAAVAPEAPAADAPPPPPSSGGSALSLPRSLMVTGRMVCPVAANGAPDCKTASDKLCQTKGFREGKSLDTDAAETCSPKVFIPGRKREPGDCRMDNFVTRAICQ